MKLKDLRAKAKSLKSQVLIVYFVSKDKRLHFYIKMIAVFCVAYALSPVDLIPDFIPILGLLDDLIIIPLCLALIIKLTPPEIMETARAMAEKSNIKPVNYLAGAFVVGIWFSIAIFFAFKYYV
jgi:uncharacterized membrane protein YkvA (DUF1232 family)